MYMNVPYTIHNMSMFLTDWRPNFFMERDVMRNVPIWVKLPQLPLHL